MGVGVAAATAVAAAAWRLGGLAVGFAGGVAGGLAGGDGISDSHARTCPQTSLAVGFSEGGEEGDSLGLRRREGGGLLLTDSARGLFRAEGLAAGLAVGGEGGQPTMRAAHTCGGALAGCWLAPFCTASHWRRIHRAETTTTRSLSGHADDGPLETNLRRVTRCWGVEMPQFRQL